MTPYASGFEVIPTGESVKKGDSLYDFSYNEKYSCRELSTNEEFTLCIMQSANLPTIFMDTDSGTIENIWADKEVEENGKIRLLSQDGELLYTGGLKSVKARGNYSFANYEKKPFSITLKDEVSLLGLGAGQKYALLSNASDPTLIRNDISRNLEKALEAEYDNVGRFVDLYANGEYLGNYYLCENIEIGTERIAVTDLEEQMDRLFQKSNYESVEEYNVDYTHAKYMDEIPEDITGGYLLEREFEDRYKLEYWENPSGFVTDNNEHFFVKSPKYCAVEQVEYLKAYMNEAEEAILSPESKISPKICTRVATSVIFLLPLGKKIRSAIRSASSPLIRITATPPLPGGVEIAAIVLPCILFLVTVRINVTCGIGRLNGDRLAVLVLIGGNGGLCAGYGILCV
jgi:hypothetical protein